MALPTTSKADKPGALDVDEVLRQIMQDDQEEWEYEYSTTETETFYLTMELSYPEFKGCSTLALPHNRGGYYKGGTDAGAVASEAKKSGGVLGEDEENDKDKDENDGDENVDVRNDATKQKATTARVKEVGDDDDMDEEENTALVDPALKTSAIGTADKQKKNKKTQGSDNNGQGEGRADGDDDDEEENDEVEDIQILDLHSARPLISYRGRVFEGRWAEVMGTEAILAYRDNKEPLPALRNLAEGIDVLAASSSRIMTTEKLVNPKEPEADALAAIRDEWNIRIPAGKHRTQEKMQQLRFLENMMALKKKKGQTDEVTVYATDGAGKDWSDKRGLDYRPRLVKRTTNNRGIDEDQEEEEEEEEEEEGEGEEAESPDVRRRRRLTQQQRRRRRRQRRAAEELAARGKEMASQGSRSKLTRDEADGRDEEGDTTMTGVREDEGRGET